MSPSHPHPNQLVPRGVHDVAPYFEGAGYILGLLQWYGQQVSTVHLAIAMIPPLLQLAWHDHLHSGDGCSHTNQQPNTRSWGGLATRHRPTRSQTPARLPPNKRGRLHGSILVLREDNHADDGLHQVVAILVKCNRNVPARVGVAWKGGCGTTTDWGIGLQPLRPGGGVLRGPPACPYPLPDSWLFRCRDGSPVSAT